MIGGRIKLPIRREKHRQLPMQNLRVRQAFQPCIQNVNCAIPVAEFPFQLSGQSPAFAGHRLFGGERFKDLACQFRFPAQQIRRCQTARRRKTARLATQGDAQGGHRLIETPGAKLLQPLLERERFCGLRLT